MVALAAILLLPLPALAQQRVPLQKSDLIRLLSGETYSKSEVAAIIRQNCLTFTSSERDRADMQALGATAEVIEAIVNCEQQANSVSLALSALSLVAPAGGQTRFVVDLTRGGLPVSGASVQLVGSGRVPGGAGADLVVRSNEAGRAEFQVPAGTAANTYTLTVVVSGETTLGASTVTLQTQPGPARRAQADPPELVADTDPDRRTTIIRLTDEYGNAVAGAVQVNTDTTGSSRVIASAIASEAGGARVTIPIDDLAGSSALGIFTAGQWVGTIGVGQGGADDAGTQFVSGAGQTAEAGESLARLLVLEVRDASGAPLADQEVRFSVTNGRVNPEVIGTDANGQVATRVTLGSQGGLTEVQAAVGSIQRNTSFESVAGNALDDNLRVLLDDARRKLEAGNARGARAAYQEILEADPRNADAQAGLAESLLATGQAEQAVRWYEVVASSAPGDADVWVALGNARAAAGQPDGAKVAYETALSLDPDLQEARRGLNALAAGPVMAEISAWGGNTQDNGRDPGIRLFEVEIRPAGRVTLRGGYRNSLDLRHPHRLRGADDIEEGFGGFAVRWGSGTAQTSVEVSRRQHPGRPPSDLLGAVQFTTETSVNLEQRFSFQNGSHVTIGGEVGHLFFRDDTAFYIKGGILAFPGVLITPGVSVANNVGSNIVDSTLGRIGLGPEKEVRGSFGLEYTSPSGFGIAPTASYGSVSDASLPELEGGLFDGRLHIWIPLSRHSRVNLLLLHQSPPGTDSFTTFGLGFTIGVRRTP